MAFYDTKITLSESAKKRIPELRNVLEDIKSRKFTLEIVGIIAVGSENEITIAATLKETYKSEKSPGKLTVNKPKPAIVEATHSGQ